MRRNQGCISSEFEEMDDETDSKESEEEEDENASITFERILQLS